MVMNNVFSHLAQVSILYTVLFYYSLNFCFSFCDRVLVTESHPASALLVQGWEAGTTMPRMSSLL